MQYRSRVGDHYCYNAFKPYYMTIYNLTIYICILPRQNSTLIDETNHTFILKVEFLFLGLCFQIVFFSVCIE